MNPSFELNLDHPMNEGVVRYLQQINEKAAPPLRLPDSVKSPFYTLGSHPDVVERVWKKLGASLPSHAAVIAYGSPALVHPGTGIVIALGMGTTYAIRIVEGSREEAIKAGACPTHNYTTMLHILDVSLVLGPDWLFGCWDERESAWCQEVYQSLSR